MKIIIKKQGFQDVQYNIPFSIGDIVRVVSYGNRFCAQQKCYESTSFYDGKSLNLAKFDCINYDVCDGIYHDLQWIVSDIGVMEDMSYTRFLVVKITTRNKEELLIQYKTDEPTRCLEVVRKGKKQINEYIINLKN